MPKGLQATLSTAVNFIPLILLWSIPNKEAFLLALTAAGILILFNIIKGSFNIMPIVLFLYIGISIVLFYYFKLDFVLELKYLISYIVSFSMGIISLLLGKPYTMYSAKAAYPKGFEVSPLFIEVNVLITKIWTLIYFLCTVLALFDRTVFSVIFINLLIALGIGLSILIPDLMPNAN